MGSGVALLVKGHCCLIVVPTEVDSCVFQDILA